MKPFTNLLKTLTFLGTLILTGCALAHRPSAQPTPDAYPDAYAQMITRPIWQTLRINQHVIDAEVADKEESRTLGLMYRTSMPENHGMVFVYPSARKITMWMKNTRLALDVAFLTAEGNIINIETMRPESLDYHSARQPAMYSLEMNAGWFKNHGVLPGTRIYGLPDYHKAQN
ncbi:MAG: DUF192 domain-containing protein [Pseudomonadota bacterium]